MYQSLLYTLPEQCKYWPDCYPVKTAVAKGPDVATDPRNPLARIHGMLHTAYAAQDMALNGGVFVDLRRAGGLHDDDW